MKLLKVIYYILFGVFTVSCEEVVEVDLEENDPKLVVEASVEWIKDSDGKFQQIKLTKTAPFYQEENPPVEDASVKVTSDEGQVYHFEHQAAGNYETDDFNPIIGEQYHLEITLNDQTYTATETMISVPDIDHVEQTNTGGFSGNEFEVKAFYTDPFGEHNYYLFRFINRKISLDIYDDKFTDGNMIFGYYSSPDIEAGDEIRIQMAGISRSFYNYLFVLRSQVGSGGGPFEAQPATVKGNVINKTNPENYPFGYFRLSQVDTTTYIVE